MGMELNVKVDPEQINKMVSEAVLQSAIGEALKGVIDREVKALGTRGLHNPLEAVVRRQISDMVGETLTSEYRDVLKQKVHDAVAEKMTDDFIGKLIEAGFRNF